MTSSRAVIDSPLGRLAISATAAAIVNLDWTTDRLLAPETPLLMESAQQLCAYFDDSLRQFDLPLAPAGAPFEQAVWAEMLKIPAGETRAYGDLAATTGRPARAVGGACGRNPIPIIIPCHRVVGADGRMVGYSGEGGVETKQWLLRHEGALLL